MLKTIANSLERFDASIDTLDDEQAKTAIRAALDAVRELLGAMTVEVFYLSEISEGVLRNDNRGNKKKIPYFLRFTESLDPHDSDASDKQERIYYDPNADGIWTLSYQQNREIWIEDRWIEYENNTRTRRPRLREPVAMEDRVAMENMAAVAGEDRKIERNHNIFWNSVNSAIVVPFFYKLGSTFIEDSNTKGLISHQTNGFISFEFKKPKRYDSEQLFQLCRIRESVADLIWKSYARSDSFDGTSHAVRKFQEECQEAVNNFPFAKTGVLSSERRGYENLTSLIRTAFVNNRIVMQVYDGDSDEIGISEVNGEIASRIRKVHFAVFDLTESSFPVDMLLSVLFSEKKPCLILHDNSEVARHPLITEIERDRRMGRDTNQLLDTWFYENKQEDEGYLFFKNVHDERREWIEVWDLFLHSVEEISEPFRMASDDLDLEDE
ncbi:MAG: hypothetical protein AAF050_01795 [Cyanobacteria bacterium J06649_5]